jgi:hypothetical protein
MWRAYRTATAMTAAVGCGAEVGAVPHGWFPATALLTLACLCPQ